MSLLDIFGGEKRRKGRSILAHPTLPNVSVLPLTRGLSALIDSADVSIVNVRSWSVRQQAGRKTRYAQAMTKSRKPIQLHRLLWLAWGLPETKAIDHINGDGLDCRRINLRAATNSQNVMNRTVRADNRVGIKGVRRMTDGRTVAPWTAEIKANGVRYRLGYFATPDEAGRAYARAAEHLHGAFSRTT